MRAIAPPRGEAAEGELSLFVAGEQLLVGPGQAALAPREAPHAYRVESEQARWLVITSRRP